MEYFDRERIFDCLEYYGHFNNINSSIPWTQYIISSVSSSIYFICILWFPYYKSFVSLGRFIFRYFILFDAVINWIASLISLFDLLLLLYRNATDFCVLILFPATLWTLVVYWLHLQDFLCIASYHLHIVTVLLVFQFGFLLFLFLLWLLWPGLPKLLNESGNSGYTCLVPDLRGNAFSFSSLSMMLALGLSYMAFIMLR